MTGHSKPGIDNDKKSVAGDDDDVDGYHISYAGKYLEVNQPMIHRSHSSLGGGCF